MCDTITITSDVEKYRLVCRAEELYGAERGHTSWYPIVGVFRCWECAKHLDKNPEIDPHYEKLLDQRTGCLVSRDEVVLAIEREATPTGV